METSIMAPQGMVVTPHHLATQTALAILREGGTAMEAMVAAAATIAVVYPHMNSIGGDGFWLIVPPHSDPVVIEACGAAGSLASVDFLAGEKTIPFRGIKSALTVPGTIGGWQEALNYVRECGYQNMSVSRLLADAIRYAEDGFPVSGSLIPALIKVKNFEDNSETFKEIFLPNGIILKEGEKLYQKKLAGTLRNLSEQGLSSFYRGIVADLIAEDMAALNMAITKDDLANYTAVRRTPLRMPHKKGDLYNLPPPTQGTVSLAILGMLDKLNIDGKDEGQFIHTTVEATKQAFKLRDQYLTDPKYMNVSNPQSLLSDKILENMVKNINPDIASSSGSGKVAGDTIWMGIMDNRGFSVSFIQSIYHHFGSGIVLPQTGITCHNRGTAFVLNQDHLRALKPGKKPYHTLNPAAAKLHDGRVMVYGTRGGDGQPQTQAAIFHRYVVQGLGLQKSVSSPRWVYGRTVGDMHDRLLLEERFSNATVEYLRKRGHEVALLPSFSEDVGQAGALVRHSNGMLEGAGDPRSDGNAADF
ncbi:oxamate amidohydrolase proenzyme-like [Cydia splendana]|uniref:oxamate amidohydrolase proenzyme-like n=1 Tax=Cydia splendana TaxID=1100963 RepID=UPI00300C9849